MIQIITDTASDITVERAESINVELVELPLTFEDGPCPQRTEEDFRVFYQRLAACKQLPVTSRPAPEEYLKRYQAAKQAGDDVLVLTLSSGLSGTYQSAVEAKKMAGYDRVYVVDTHQAILTQRMLVEYAVRLREEGYDVRNIMNKVIENRDRVAVCGVVGSLTYLRKGGRIPAGLAVLGKALRIKPVIALQDKTLKTIGQVRSYQAGIAMLHKQMEKDGVNKAYPFYFGYTNNKSLGEKLMRETVEKYGHHQASLHPVGGIIGTHCGMDCMAVAYMKLGC